MATYQELMIRAEKLLAEAEEVRLKELEGVIASIKEQVKTHGLTAADLGLSFARGSKKGSAATRRTAADKPPAEVKYRGPNGEAWSGGRGRKPNWVGEILASGKSIEDFAVNKRAKR